MRERAGLLDAHLLQLLVDRRELLNGLDRPIQRQLEETEDGPVLGFEDPVANAVAELVMPRATRRRVRSSSPS